MKFADYGDAAKIQWCVSSNRVYVPILDHSSDRGSVAVLEDQKTLVKLGR